MRPVFPGKPLHWVVLATIICVLVLMGRGILHVRAFNVFLVIILALGLGAVSIVLFSTRKNERVTREPTSDLEAAQITSDD